jgi:hypothetical protein
MSNPDKVKAGKLGGSKRSENLTADEKSAIGIKANAARQEKEKDMAKATHRGELKIEDVAIPCAVLDNGHRVLSENGINNILGASGGETYAMKASSVGILGSGALPLFLVSKALQPYVQAVFGNGELNPIEYKDSRRTLTGYPAEILPKVCEVWLRARDAGALQTNQLPKAQKAEMLMRGLAHIGIVALVDEVTGYQESRDRQSLHKLLEAYLSNEKLAWAKKFPDEFYQHIYRLKGWTLSSIEHQRPGYVGKLTNQLVYEKLPKGVLEELQVRNPTNGNSNRKWRHHQFLSVDIGQTDLRDHLLQLIAVMRISKDWDTFILNFEAAFPATDLIN